MMLSRIPTVLPIFICLIFYSCYNPNPNRDKQGVDPFDSLAVERKIDENKMAFQALIYVPTYSEIYTGHQNMFDNLTTTLSIRNTSRVDSLFVNQVEYFNENGDLIREFLDQPISLRPMSTVNYVIEEKEHGASFLVSLKSKNEHFKPIVQSIMVGQYSNKGFAWYTDGHIL